jgi:hypothetical protein
VSQLGDPEETQPLEPVHLVGMTTDSLMDCRLFPRTALKLFAFKYPVNNYYLAVKEGQNPSPPIPEKSFVVVFRHADVVWRMALAENEYRLLDKLFAGAPIGVALDELQTELDLPEDELSNQVTEWFSHWMRNGLLAWHEYMQEPRTRNNA